MPDTSRVPHAFPRAEANLMFDLGAHKGEVSEFYLRKGWCVFALEAHPTLAGTLPYRFLGDNDFLAMWGAITERGEDCELHVSTLDHHGQTHSLFRNRVRDPRDATVTVRGTTLPTLFKMFGIPRYLKIDIEGADFIAIRQLDACESLPLHISVELCEKHPEQALEMFHHLDQMGYNQFLLLAHTHQTPPVDVDRIQEDYCWLTLHEVLRDWFTKEQPVDGIWYDLHSKHKDAP